MAFVPAVNVVRVAVEMNQAGHVTVNVYHFLSPHPVTVADLTAIGSNIATWVTGHLIGQMAPNVTVTNINLRDLTTAGGAILDVPMTSGNVGTASGSPLSNAMALVASWRTGLAGRSFRGRTYVPGVTSVQLAAGSDNLVSTGTTTALVGVMNALVSQLATAGYELVITSFRNAGAPRTTAVSTVPNAIIVNQKLDNQRRRMKGSS